VTSALDLLPDPFPVQPLTEPPDVVLNLPGSKSHTNRALVCAALANGSSELRRMLFANDTEAMLDSVARLGVNVERDQSEGRVVIGGGLSANRFDGEVAVDVRQSGTTGRFLLPVLAALPGRFVLDGDPQLRARPFGPQLDALRQLSASVIADGTADGNESLPMKISGHPLPGGPISVAGSLSSQFLSGLLLAAPLFASPATITVAEGGLVSQPYVRLTLTTMAQFGVEVEVADDAEGLRYEVPSDGYRAADIDLEPDASAASYFFAAAAATGGRVRVNGLGSETVQGDLQFVGVLQKMGAEVEITRDWTEVRGTGRLRGVDVDMSDISDTAQTLAVVAALADGPSRIRGIGFIRAKETDRLAAPVAELNRLGVRAEADDDGMTIWPDPPSERRIAGRVETYDDHRMAMSFAILGLVHPGVEIADPGCVAKTFPEYFAFLDSLRSTHPEASAT
jgi:3-phosphoshikimate 1-carboxyvinyltransferase